MPHGISNTSHAPRSRQKPNPMRITKLRIKNFRGIKDLTVNLDETTVLIGENNTGKSTILAALEVGLKRNLTRQGSAFPQYDYHLPERSSQPADSDGIEITLWFAEQEMGEWPDEIAQTLGRVVQTSDDGLQSIILRVTSSYNNVSQDFETTTEFLNSAGGVLPGANPPANLPALRRLAPLFYLSALRDAAQEFRPQGQFWRPFVRSLKMDAQMQADLERQIVELNQKVLDTNESLAEVTERLRNTADMVPLANNEAVGIEAIPSRLFDIMSRTQVLLSSVTGARLPIGKHGDGTQSLAVICLFDAFLRSKLADTYHEHSSPILALEEPEAHLHPSATLSAASLLRDLPGQKIVTSHSGDMVGAYPLPSLRRLRRQDGAIVIHSLDENRFQPNELRKINYHIRSNRGSVLFARSWLLVEGETDRVIFEACARALNQELSYDGISIIEFAQIGISPLVKFADSLGLEWHVVADNDPAGDNYVKNALKHLGSQSRERRISQLQHGDLELFLCMEGYGSIFERYIADEKEPEVVAEPGSLEYWKQVVKALSKHGKPRGTADAAQKIEEQGAAGVPDQLHGIVNLVASLAREVQDG